MAYFSPYHRASVRQLRSGIDDGDLCVPCQKAFREDGRAGFADIGSRAWLNDGYEGYEDHTEPILYCCCCRQVLRAREFAKRRNLDDVIPPNTQQPKWYFDGLATNVFLHSDSLDVDEVFDKSLEDFKVTKSEYSRSIRHHWADVERIKGWLNGCEHQHSNTCNRHREFDAGNGTLLLVDVLDDCLVLGGPRDRYFALSYVWGTSKQFLTLVENYNDLRKPGNLLTRPLTQTIRDSMSFVKSLGERYLWIDTVCIIQDDAANKAKAIAQMCSIYGQAVATIIALSGGSADAGLPGIPPTARNTTTTYAAPGLHVVERSILDQMIKNHTYDSVDCIYNTRAWTFQERLLSNRSIIFLAEQVYFHCKKHLVCEDRVNEDDMDFYTLEKMRTTSARLKARAKSYSPLDEFRWYEQLVVEYTTKKMGYPDDILNAFTGVQTELQNMFAWTFVSGLPEPLLDLALLWTPVNTAERRITASQQPSWSWAGWIGQVRYADLVRPGHRPVGSLFNSLSMRSIESPNRIKFTCMSVELRAFDLEKTKKRLLDPFESSLVSEDSYFIVDKTSRRCGMLIGLSAQDELRRGNENLKLLQLSAWRSNNSLTINGPLIAYLLDDGNRSDEKLFDESLPDTEWCTFNVMLVRSVGALWERVAIGQIHQDAWTAAGEKWDKFAVQ